MLADDGGSFYNGLDASLTGLVHYPGNGTAVLQGKLEAIKAKAKAALIQYRADDVIQSGILLLEGASLLYELRADLGEREQALVTYLEHKQNDFEETAVQCLGLDLDCLADYAHVTPGQQFRVTTQLWNPRNISISDTEFSFGCLKVGRFNPLHEKKSTKLQHAQRLFMI